MLLIFGIFGLLLQTGCGPSQEVATAELLTALATKTMLVIPGTDLAVSSLTVPAQISCNRNVFILNTAGAMTMSGSINFNTSDATLDFSFQFNAQGPGIYGAVSTAGTSSSTSGTSTTATPTPTTTSSSVSTAQSTSVTTISCSFPAKFAYDSTAGMLKGSGTIPTCEHFQCIVNGTALDCTKFQAAMATTTCN